MYEVDTKGRCLECGQKIFNDADADQLATRSIAALVTAGFMQPYFQKQAASLVAKLLSHYNDA